MHTPSTFWHVHTSNNPFDFNTDKGFEMRAAFHFDEGTAFKNGVLHLEASLFKAINTTIATHKRHLYILSGSVIYETIERSFDAVDLLTQNIFGIETAAWSTLTTREMTRLLISRPICAYVLDGLTAYDARHIHELLKIQTGYLGALEVQANNQLPWVIYIGQMPAKYRIVADELRMLHREFELEIEDNREHHTYNHWKDSRLFSNVTWEDAGVRDTIFDPYRSWEYVRISGETEQLAIAQLSGVVNEIFLRVAHLDPRLIHPLHGALKAFDQLDNMESLAHVSLSCRRLIEKLADALMPPTTQVGTGGRKLGKAEYRNRLWHYIEENLSSNSQKEIILANHKDIGTRLDKLDKAANKGLHGQVSATETQRLLVALTSFLYDILTITSPSLSTPSDPYNESVTKFTQDVLKHHPKMESND